jgi:opacity protein-like surface antigen
MKNKLLLWSIPVLLLILGAASSSAQVVYSAEQGSTRLSVGGGLSGYSPDVGGGFWLGPALWVDYNPPFNRGLLHGLGLEAEARGVLWNSGSSPQNSQRNYESTVGGGIIYHPGFLRTHAISPYVKILASLGWNPIYQFSGNPFLVYQFGGGLDYHLNHRVTIRGDYEYQRWEQVPSYSHPGELSVASPNGFTVGALYNFGHR